MDIQFEEEYIQKYANGKLYMRDKFCRQYTAEMLEICDVPGVLDRLGTMRFCSEI